MKKFFSLFVLSMLGLFCYQVDANACSAQVSGPSGRCGATPNTPVTYTGTHNFTSNGCTFYEWTINGGTVTSPNGASVTNGTLCITENLGCWGAFAGNCANVDLDFSVAGGGGSDVTVTWDPGVNGTLRLRVREVGSITLADNADTGVDLTLPNVNSLTASTNNNTSTTFTPVLSNTLCAGQQVRWTLNGNPAGTGTSKTFNVGPCASGTVCAFTTQTVGGTTMNTGQICRSYTGGSFNGSISGASETTPFSFNDYQLFINQPFSTATWDAQPASAANFVGGNTGSGVLVTFNQEGIINICASGTTNCGTPFQVCKLVDVDDNNIGGPLMTAPEDDELVKESTSEAADMELNDGGWSDDETSANAAFIKEDISSFRVFPSLARSGQEITVQLPHHDQQTELFLTNMQGQQVMQQVVETGTTSFNTSNLPSGVYILSARAGKWMESTRIVIQ